MSTYSKANTTAQWFQDDYPGSVLNLTAETMVLVVHTTEGMTWPGYNGGATAPNYTGMPPLGSKAGSWRAHFPDERSSRALRNLSGGVATNTLNAVQVELIGTCDPAHAKTWGSKKAGVDYVYWPNANDAQLKWLAHFVADMRKRHGLRLVFPTFKAYPGSYGATSTRLTFAEWRNFAGICGHQHVPENAHGDPGNINMAKVVSFAKAILDPTPTPPAAPRSSGMSWNVKANRSWTTAILPPLRDILAEHKPSVVALQECYDAPDLRGLIPGYAFRYQALGYEAENPGYIEEHSANVMLVRDDVEVKVQAALEMEETWKGPNLGIMHDPRIHRRVTVEEDGINWRYGDVHAPPPLSSGFNNDAIAETNAAIVHCLNTFPQDEPVIFMGDMNQTNSQVVTRIGSKADAVVDGGGIDLAVFKNCRKVKGENLGNFGSDHPVKIWTFEA